jgi:hypothetical protein
VSVRRAWPAAAAALATGGVLVPNSHHALLAGIPLSLLGSAALVLALALPALRAPAASRRGRVLALLVFVLAVKILVAAIVPPRGFRGEYYTDASFAGAPHRRVDRDLRLDATTFRLELFNERPFWSVPRGETLPFSVTWRGGIAPGTPTRLVVEAAGSEPVRVEVDGGAVPDGALVGAHEVLVRFARATPAPPAVRVAIRTADGAEVPVFAGRVAPWQVALAKGYGPVATGLDGLLLLVLAWAVGRGVMEALAAPGRRRWEPPLAVAGLAVMALWFVVGAVRTGARFTTMEFLTRGDDWIYYESMARDIAAGDLLGGRERIFSSSFIYPYWVGGLHVLFGDPLWPVYFAQYLGLGLACVALGRLGKALWGERLGVGVLVAAAALGALDVSRWYPIRLLSENLALVVVPVMFLGLHACVTRPGVGTGAVAGALLAGAVLTRFNLLPFAALAVAYLVWRRPERGAPGATVALVAGFVLVYGLMPLREHLASGVWAFLPESSLNTFVSQPGSLGEQWRVSWTAPVTRVILPNLAFMLGYPKLYAAAYSLRPHWAVLWLAYLAWLWKRRALSPGPTMTLVHLYVVLYAGVMVANAYIGGYGYRYLLPLFFVLVLFLPPALDDVRSAGRGDAA